MKVPLSNPDISKKEKLGFLKILDFPHLCLGPKLREFEEKMADYVGTRYAVAVNSGTSGLHLTVRALGIKKNDEVITTPFSFIASSNCLLYEKAIPVFVDIRPDSLNIDPQKIEEKITKKTKAILAVDVFGHPADWIEIHKIARKYKLKLIEDSCEALGSEYHLKKCGTFADCGVFSFYPNKQITTAEGGMVVTNSKHLAQLIRSMSNQGRELKEGRWLNHVMQGFNYRLSDIHSALGVIQLSRIKEILRKREKVAAMYTERLKGVTGIVTPFIAKDVKLSWFVFVIRLAEGYTAKDRDIIITKMSKAGVQCSNYFMPIHLQPFYQKTFGYKKGRFPVCEYVSERTIALPFYNNLSEEKIDLVVRSLKKFL